MPRYFFHVHDGRHILDDEGVELAHLPSARQEALRFTGQLIAEDDGWFWSLDEWRLEVTDANRVTLFTLTLMAVDPSTVLEAV